MFLKRNGKKIVWVVFIIILILITNIQKSLKVKIFMEPNSTSRVNWDTDGGLNYTGSFEDIDGDGEIIIKLPKNTTLISIGREFNGQPNISIIELQPTTLINYKTTFCPVILASSHDSLLNTCHLTTLDVSEDDKFDEVTIQAGEIMNMSGVYSKNITSLFEGYPSIRYAAIELIETNAAINSPDFSGNGRIVGYDQVFASWDFFSTARFED